MPIAFRPSSSVSRHDAGPGSTSATPPALLTTAVAMTCGRADGIAGQRRQCLARGQSIRRGRGIILSRSHAWSTLTSARARRGGAARRGSVRARRDARRASRCCCARRFRSSGCMCCVSIAPSRSCSMSPRLGELEITGHLIGDAPSAAEDAPDVSARALICTVRQGARVHGALWLTSSEADALHRRASGADRSVADSRAGARARHRSTTRAPAARADRQPRAAAAHRWPEALDIRQVFPQVSEAFAAGCRTTSLRSPRGPTDGLSSASTRWPAPRSPTNPFWAPTLLDADERTSAAPGAVHHPRRRTARLRRKRSGAGCSHGSACARRCACRCRSAATSSARCSSWRARPERFTEDDIDFARRVADHLALALSHQRLAEAARRDAEARETAARLEAQVATLTRELEARTGQRRVVGHSRAVEGRAGAGRARRADRDDRAADRRVRHRQGSRRAVHPPRVAAKQRAVRRHQLRRAARSAARIGAVRPRARRVHRRGGGQAGTHRAGQRRRAVPRRSRRDGADRPGQAAARARGARVHAPRQHAAACTPTSA